MSVEPESGAEPGGAGSAGGSGERSSLWVREEGPHAACGVTGCLYGAMALFAVLLVLMLIIVMMRFGVLS